MNCVHIVAGKVKQMTKRRQWEW